MKKRVYLPDDIMSQIITSSGMDLKTMIRSSLLVCKEWCNLVSDHISNHYKGQFLVYDFLRRRHGALDEETNKIAWMCGGPHLRRFMSSCNGLVCFLSDDSQIIDICNPLTGEYISIPGPHQRRRVSSVIKCSLGFCPSSNEYKLTCLTSDALETYTLGSPAGWRNVPFNHQKLWFPMTAAICVNGVFHWLLKTQSVLTFDLANEVLGTIPPPRLEDDKKIYQLECMDHCLVVTAGYNPPSGLEIWARKEDKLSGDSVWTKNWVIDAAQLLIEVDLDGLMPQKLSTDGRIIMRDSGVKLYSYDSIDKLVRCHWKCDRGYGRSLYSLLHSHPHFSGKGNAGMDSNGQRLRKKKGNSCLISL